MFLVRKRMSRTWCSSFGIEALRGELSDEFVVGRGSRFRRLCLLIEDVWNTWAVHCCFIHPRPLPLLLDTKLTRRGDTTDKKERRVQWARRKLVFSRALQDMCLGF